jgi:hypothetical protein
MIPFTKTLLTELDMDLREISIKSESVLSEARQSYLATREALLKLMDFIKTYKFADQQEEQFFLKHIKPKFLIHLIYYEELHYLESKKPVGCRKRIRNFFRSAISRITLFFERNQDLYNYYRSGKENFDESLLLKDTIDLSSHGDLFTNLETGLYNYYSVQISRFEAFEQLLRYTERQISKLEVGTGEDPAIGSVPKIIWKDKKVFLIEVAYLIYTSGSTNGTLKDIVAVLEIGFNTRLGNYYRTFMDMVIRKKSRTPYLDAGIVNINNHMDETLN